jgi:hypothetical protein
MEESIAQTRPQLKKIKEMYGDLSYFQYAKQKNRINLNKNFRDRKNEVITVIVNETARLLGTAIADGIHQQLKKNDSISTTEHTAPLGTVYALNAVLHMAIPMFGSDDSKMKNIITLSCSGTSFNNLLSFSRGHQFHGLKDRQIIEKQLTFFGRSIDSSTVLYSPPYKTDALKEINKQLSFFVKEGQLTGENIDKIQSLFAAIYASPHPLTGTDFVDQLTITNYYFWKKLFPEYKEQDIPNYIMLSQEKILLQLLLDYHLDHDTIVNRFLFDKEYHTHIEKFFANIDGAFSKDHNVGTFLFWGLSAKDHIRIQLFKKGNQLVSNDDTFRLDLTPQAVREAIINKTVFPGLLLTFIVLSFYYGLRLGGGTSQPNYLTQMHEAYRTMLTQLGDAEVQNTEDIITDDYVFYRPHLAFLDFNDKRIPATGMDMYLYQDPTQWQKILQATKQIALGDFMTTLLPALYKEFCPDAQKEDILMAINQQDVETFIGLDKKLPSLGTIEVK